MSISAASATVLTDTLATMETHLTGLGAAIAAYDTAYLEESRAAYVRAGLNEQYALEAQLGQRVRDVLLAQRVRGLGLGGLLAAGRGQGALGPNWADGLVSKIEVAA